MRVIVPLLLLAATFLLAAFEASRADAGPVAWWRLDGDGADASGGHHARVVGTEATTDRHGRPGGALAFDGRRSSLHTPSTPALDVDLRRESYTISLWVRATDGGVARLVQKWDEHAAHGYAYSLQTTPDGLDAVVYDPPTTHLVHVPGLWDGSWRHVAVRYDAEARILSAWRGGVLVDARTVHIRGTTRNDAPVVIGRAPPPVESRFFTGALDDVQIYRHALPDDAIRRLARE